ncbi:MAG: hypothetical protein PHS11_06070 [Eubacteriales bacterium]|nr:hypothetical protein [Eubacteriales bacterium]
MKRRLLSILLALCLMLTLVPATATTAFAAGKTKTINCGTFTLEISDVYAIDSKDKSATDGYYTTYCVVVPDSAKIKCTQEKEPLLPNSYLIWPFNDLVFENGPMWPVLERACEYDDTITVNFTQGSTMSLAVNNWYSFTGGENLRYYIVNVYVVDAEKLMQFGGPKVAKKFNPVTSNVPASPSKTDFVVKGLDKDARETSKLITQAYSINNTNYLQLRAIATLLNRTDAQFNIGWDDQYAVIEPGKAYSGTVTGSKMQTTKYVRPSGTKFKMNEEVFSFADARLINGDTNYIQLREFAQKLSGTASQFNVYWDSTEGKVIVQPGVPYTGTKYEAAVTTLEQVKGIGDVLPDSKYYMRINGKYITPVKGGQYWLELSDKRPDMPFEVKLASKSEAGGPKYSIGYDGTYIMLPGSADGAQLQSTTSKTPHYWRIDTESSYCTVRDYSKQELIVNAGGTTSKGNTKVIGSSSAKPTSANAKIELFTEGSINGSKTVVQMKSYPDKTNYTLGEGFDSTGFNAVIIEDGTEKNVNDEITFYTSKVVELIQGRPFTTTGKKVVEIRYNGDKIAEYTIVVTEN